MPTPSIRLNDELYHAAKHSDTSIGQLSREGIERGIIREFVGVCWFCGSGIMAKERTKTLDRGPGVQVCGRCFEDLEAVDEGDKYEMEEPYLKRAYEGGYTYDLADSFTQGSLYDFTSPDLPDIWIAYAAESIAVSRANSYHAAEDTDGTYWAAKSRGKRIVQDDRIPWIEIALQNHALSLATGEPTFPVFQYGLREAMKRAGEWKNSRYRTGPPGAEFSFDDVVEQMGGEDEGPDYTKFKALVDPEFHCQACGCATEDRAKECEFCFHRWEDCPDPHFNDEDPCDGTVVFMIDTDGRHGEEWLSTNCWKCGEYRQAVIDDYTKERFKKRYGRVFKEIEHEHVAIDPQIIPE